jgi:N6-adenosine-specific RNA methylase IME4
MENLIRIGQQSLEFGAFQLQPTGLIIGGAPSLQEWEQCGVLLRRMEGAVQWWIGDWLNYGEHTYGEKYTAGVATLGLEEQTLTNYAYVAQNVKFYLRRENLSFSVQKEVAPLSQRQQGELLDQAEANHWTVAEMRQAIRALKRLITSAAILPPGQFRVIYADPPWQYRDSGVIVTSDAYGRAERHYPTLSIEELEALPIREHVAEEAVLFLWVTSPLLGECWPVIDAWGFEYKTNIVWDKVAHNYGHYVSVRHEFLMLCTRGSCLPDQPTPMPDSVITIPRSERHSEKPSAFRDLIDRLYPHGPALELFGRQAPGGRWTTFGNQLEISA